MAEGASCFVFDGTNDFRLWRARLEGELISRGLLGHVLVRGYNGTQSFAYKGKQMQPKLREGLSDADALKEENDAVNCMRRFLHPTVETQIANQNAFDSWATLYALYGSGGSVKINEMYRALSRMRFGEKKDESMERFATHWNMTMQHFEQATGSEFPDSVRSAMFEDALPTSWRSLVAGWQGTRPITPYSELLGKVLAEDKRSASRPREDCTKSRQRSPSRAPSERARQPDENDKCFYCFRTNHSFKQCTYLLSDIDKGATHNERSRYACIVTKERTPPMVEALEAFVAEKTKQSVYGPPTSQGDRKRGREDERGRGDYSRRSQSRPAAQRRSPERPAHNGFRNDRGRSRSVYRSDRAGRSQSVYRDDRAERSQSVYRGDRAGRSQSMYRDRAGRSQSAYRGDRGGRSQSSFRDDRTDRSRSSARGDSDFFFPPRKQPSFERRFGS